MTSKLNDRDWHYILQMLYRLNGCQQTVQFQRVCMDQLKVLIPFTKAIFFLASRADDHIIHYAPVSEKILAPQFEEIFMQENYPNSWAEFQFSPWCSVKRNSEIYKDNNEFEHTRVYRELYQPQDIYHAIQTVLIHNDTLLGILAVFRPQNQPDFEDSEMQIMNLLKEHLALKLYFLKERASPATSPDARLPQLAEYGFTRREMEIIELVADGVANSEISKQCFISTATLRKHLNNIYRKTNVSNRLQLFQLMQQHR